MIGALVGTVAPPPRCAPPVGPEETVPGVAPGAAPGTPVLAGPGTPRFGATLDPGAGCTPPVPGAGATAVPTAACPAAATMSWWVTRVPHAVAASAITARRYEARTGSLSGADLPSSL